MLELPVKIEFSKIGRLSLKVPWKSITSSPVDVIVEDILLILTPTKENDWTTKDFDNFELKS